MSDDIFRLSAVERRYTIALGRRIRALRIEAGLSRAELARRALLLPKSLGSLERARRTRRSTLARIASALASPRGARALLAELVELAGPALVPELPNAAELERERAQRFRRKARDEARELARLLRGQALGSLTPAEAARLPWLLATMLRAATTARKAADLAARILRQTGAQDVRE